MKHPDEQLFRQLIEELPLVTYVVELNDPRRMVFVSHQISDLFGYTAEEWMNQPNLWKDLIHPDDRDAVLEKVRRHDQSETPCALEYRAARKDGVHIWVRNDLVYVRDAGDAVACCHGVMRDITRRRQLQGAQRRLTHDLGERVKELTCLYEISNLVEAPDLGLTEVLDGVVALLPLSWEQPEDACCRLVLDREYRSDNFKETPWVLSSPVVVHGKPAGVLEVRYLTLQPQRDDGPFVKEERMLLDVVAGRVGRIIERVQAEEELSRARERYAALVDNLNVGIYRNTPGPEGHFLQGNPKMLAMFDASSREELFAHLVSDLYQHPEEREAFSAKLMRDGIVNDEELQLKTLKGRPFWASVTAVKKEDEDGQIYFDGVVEDITDRKMVELQLRLQSAALQSAANGIVITDLQGTILWVNQAFTALTGYESFEAIGKNTRILKSGKQPPEIYQEMWTKISAGEVWRGEIINRRKNGTLYSEDMTITPVLDEDGVLTNFVAIKQDISERKTTEAKLAQYADQLEVRQQEIEEDLDMAREVQEAMLPQQYPSFPPSAPPEESALRFNHIYYPSGKVSGDFFDVLALSDSSVGLLLCDVMGHGIRAALVTAIVRGITEELTLAAHDPGEYLTELNRDFIAIFKHTQRGMFATLFYMVADIRSGELRYANAGHPSPLRASRRKKRVDPLPLMPGERGPALGLTPDARYRTCTCPLDLQDLFVLFTDGICEIERPDRTSFGEERLAAAVAKRLDMPPERLFQEIVVEAEAFSEGLGFTDDVCLIGMEVTKLGL